MMLCETCSKAPHVYPIAVRNEMISKYSRVMRMSWQTTVTYRLNLVLSMFYGLLPLLAIYYLWLNVYEEQSSVGDYALPQMISYYVLAFFVYQIVSPFGLEWEIASDIREGYLSRFLVHPIDYLNYQLWTVVAEKALTTVIRLPFIVLVVLLLREYIVPPGTPGMGVAFALSVLLSLLLYFLIAYCVSLSTFWWEDVAGLFYVQNAFIGFFSGLTIPLNLLPASVFSFSTFLPFYYITFFPIQMYLGKVTWGEAAYGLLLQAGWIIVLYACARALWKYGLRRYMAAGG